ncbi:hypothetical protein ED28_09540 [[Pantoea] beijingensis]|uniref:DUF1090 domain-containing protein n=1 Tax=[Pantoea] beijingensis TaxID=1324864 RepID=A0A443ICM3_9GAMM|nr:MULTISPECIES: DUF1090 family protein [Erwiniaceae]RWR01874.1 hypothetical protein ED28_09540 [[Pantoea] beijingensis]
MKKIALTFILATFSCGSFAATDSCSEQVSDISGKLEIAKNSGNTAEVARLNTALGQVKTFCTDERQANRAAEKATKHEQKVKKAELELQEAEHELDVAKTDGRADKITKKTHKVEEKKLKLETAKSELEQSQADVERLK